MIDLLKLLFLLGFTVVLLVRKLDLGLVLFLNTGLVAILFGYPALDLLRSTVGGMVAPDTLSLAGAVYLVLVLAELMRRTDATADMVTSLQMLVPDSRITLALMPLMIGLLPMLGGAMFSAPMVDEVGTPLDVSAEGKTFVNYWFRHAMEYVFPLYSSLLVIAALLEVTVFDVIRFSWPLTLVALAGGVIWGLRGIEKHLPSEAPQNRAGAWFRLFGSTWPLLVVVLAVVVLRLNMVLSLIGVIAIFVAVKRIPPREWWDILKRSFPVGTFSAIFGVMVFKHVVEDAGAVTRIPQALSVLGLPAMLVGFVVPMIVGLLTGTAAAALALSVPLVAPLIDGGPLGTMAAGVWLFVGGFSGVLLSPLHLCLALTKEYFEASWGPIYQRIVPSVALVVLAAMGLVLLR
ncbi:MAG: DUF401 family protein [Anaerolineae bacterium]